MKEYLPTIQSAAVRFTGFQIYTHFEVYIVTQVCLGMKRLTVLRQKMATTYYLQVVAIVSCLFVVVSTLCLIFSTLPAFQIKDEDGNISRESLSYPR